MSGERDLVVSTVGASADDARDWDGYVQSHSAGTVYHLSAWRRIFAEGLGYPSWLLLARHRASGAVAGVLPLYLVRGLRSRRLVSVPFRDRGGVLWSCPEAFIALVAEARRLSAAEGTGALQLKSVDAYPDELVRQTGLVESRYWVHSRVDLTPYAGGSLLEELGVKVRNMVTQAKRQGLQASVVPPEARHRDEWYGLHVLTQRKLGLPPFPERFFQAMFDELGPTGVARLCMVRDGTAVTAASILLLHSRTGIYGYSASDPNHQRSRPNDLMLFTSMQWLIESGYSSFDMGSDAPSQEGLLFFKRKWLARQASIPSYGLSALSGQPDSSSPAYAAARAALRIMPPFVLRGIASRFVRYFG